MVFNVIFKSSTWFKAGLIVIIMVLVIGVVQFLIPSLFLHKIEGNVVAIKQHYGAEGSEKLITLQLGQHEAYNHYYINKDYLPSPHLNDLTDYKQLITYVSKSKKGHFYGLELPDGTIIQSVRFDIICAYFNNAFVAFILLFVPIGLYFVYGRNSVIEKQDQALILLYGFVFCYIWGKLHFFLMALLVFSLIGLGKKLSNKNKKQAVDEDLNLPAS